MYPKLLAAASLLLSFSISVFGQGADAVLAGTVTDPNDAVITQVKVVAQNTATGVVSNAQTAEGAGVTEPVISTPVLVGALSPGLGQVQRIGNGVVYINIIPAASGSFQSVSDPSRNSITARSPFSPFPLISSQSTMRAIADASGNIILRNPLPGEFGNLQQNYLTGPGFWRLDMNLLKRFRITEAVSFTLRADAFNVTNTPRFGNPNTNINDQNGFGRITTTIGDARVITVGGRIEF